MPKVKDILPHLNDIAKQVSNIKGVTSVLLWGSLAKFADNPNAIIKDIDIIATTNFCSEDFISIIDDQYSPLKLASNQLEDEGFDPKVVEFTKQFLALKNIDHWAISGDKKLLHWGIVFDKRDSWDGIKIESEKYAASISGLEKKDLIKASQSTKRYWSLLYDSHMNKILEDNKAPNGWYLSSEDLSDILPETKKLL